MPCYIFQARRWFCYELDISHPSILKRLLNSELYFVLIPKQNGWIVLSCFIGRVYYLRQFRHYLGMYVSMITSSFEFLLTLSSFPSWLLFSRPGSETTKHFCVKCPPPLLTITDQVYYVTSISSELCHLPHYVRRNFSPTHSFCLQIYLLNK